MTNSLTSFRETILEYVDKLASLTTVTSQIISIDCITNEIQSAVKNNLFQFWVQSPSEMNEENFYYILSQKISSLLLGLPTKFIRNQKD